MRLLFIMIVFGFTAGNFSPAQAQFLRRLKEHAKKKIKREAERRSERRIDRGIDKTYDKIEEKIDNAGKKKKNNEQPNAEAHEGNSSDNNGKSESGLQTGQSNLQWDRYDFVPGDVVIFEDGPSGDEEIGEFPSRWDLYKGNAEIVELNGQTAIVFPHGGSIVPYLKNSKKDYLPEVFTIELDVRFPKGSSSSGNRIWISLADLKNNRTGGKEAELEITPHGLEFGESSGDYPGTENRPWAYEKTGDWHHISIAYTRGKFKAYFDDTRLINIPHLEVNPTGITITVDGYAADKDKDFKYIRNVRIAKGGVKYYKRVMTDGKIIINGIKFDVNKATLRPESMGPINKIYRLMKKNPDLRFSIEGHTDSDGDAGFNQKLSERRAKVVMNKLIAMGIDPSRLKYKGWGESKPIDTNNTPEGKANNRRVEFVKF